MVRIRHARRQPLKNHPSGHLGGWATPWLEEELTYEMHNCTFFFFFFGGGGGLGREGSNLHSEDNKNICKSTNDSNLSCTAQTKVAIKGAR